MTKENQKAIIWGASGGIGRAISDALIAAGWGVVAIGRQEDALPYEAQLKVEIASISDEFSLQRAAMEAGIEIESADLFVYAVGDIGASPVAEQKLDDWQRLLDANLSGAFLATHHALPLLSEGATLVYLGAIHERLRLPGLAAYAAAKAGLEAFAEALGKEQRRKTVLVVRPGAVDTPLWNKVPMKLPKGAMTPADLAQKILTLVEEGQKGIHDIA